MQSSAIILCSLYALEGSALLGALALHKRGERDLEVFLAGSAGLALIGAIVVGLVASLILLVAWRRARSRRERVFATCLAANLLTLGVGFAAAEIAVRVLSQPTPSGPMVGGTLLLPRSWEAVVARSREILRRADAEGSYFVYDDALGWTVGKSRRSENGLYLSSVEGIRSARLGETLAGSRAPERVALVGDSFTFGLEVSYEDTWASHLGSELGSDWQVLDFGVDGYGIDQAVLRYQRDALPWRPRVVVLGLIEDDLRRTLGVYAFLTFPRAEIPFPKPRFVLHGGRLVALNLPLPDPWRIFEARSIGELPFVEYDRAFAEHPAWQWQWHAYDASFAVRFLLSRFPRWSILSADVSDDALRALNAAFILHFVARVRQEGSTPIVVYFPGESELPPHTKAPGVALEILRENRIEYLDMTPCLEPLSPSERFLILHYAPAANAAIARCLAPEIRRAARVAAR